MKWAFYVKLAATPRRGATVVSPISILLLTAIEAKLIGPHGGLQVCKSVVYHEQAPWNDP